MDDTKPSLTIDVAHSTDKKGPSTLSTKATESSLSPCKAPGMPTLKTEERSSFETPENQKGKSWKSICISPTSLGEYDIAMELLQNDRMDEQDFYKFGTPRLKACVQYVYGLGLYKDLSASERIGKIFKLVGSKDTLGRLASIAFSHPRDTLMLNKGAKDAYIQMALTLDLFCNLEKRGVSKHLFEIRGGFHNKPVMMCQKGRNCFHPAAVLFVSIYHQHVDQHSLILDAAQVARRYLVQKFELLENRVIGNRGYHADEFAQEITLLEEGPAFWEKIVCAEEKELFDLTAQLMIALLKKRVGLVSGFRVEEPFQSAANKNVEYQREGRLGYFWFDGDDPTKKEGEWVSYEGHRTTSKKNKRFFGTKADRQRKMKNKAYLEKMADDIKIDLDTQNLKGKERAKQLKTTLKSELNVETDEENKPLKSPFDGDSSSSPSSQSSGIHALVLLAVERNMEQPEESKFMLLNPWQEMPLVCVSSRYLRACNATVHFLNKAPNMDNTLGWNSETRIVDCASCEIEGGDECSPESWLCDGFGLSFPEHQAAPAGLGWLDQALRFD